MTQRERQGCVIVASLFAALFLIAGSGANTFGIFLPALLKAFPHWSRAKVALLPSALFFSWGVLSSRLDGCSIGLRRGC
jgi:hypothetical protein